MGGTGEVGFDHDERIPTTLGTETFGVVYTAQHLQDFLVGILNRLDSLEKRVGNGNC